MLNEFFKKLNERQDFDSFLKEAFPLAHISSMHHFFDALQAFDYAQFLKPYNAFLQDVAKSGIEFESESEYIHNKEVAKELRKKIVSLGAQELFESLRCGNISPACKTCRKAIGSHTYILTLACNRDCFFCTNRNQDDYSNGVNKVYDIKTDFARDFTNYKLLGESIKSVAITGGEPLLYAKECASFARLVKSKDSEIDLRIYTNADLLSEETLKLLKESGVDELRIGLKQENGIASKEQLERLKAAKGYIERIVVEMPIIPNTLEKFKELILKLDEIGIYGINILEFLYPHQFASSYKALGYKLKALPYSKFFPYTYAGGLSVSGSEVESLKAMLWAMEEKVKLSIHYCSLENKLTGELYKRNFHIQLSSIETLSERDYFIEVARAYNNLEEVKSVLLANKKDFYISTYEELGGLLAIDFKVEDMPLLSHIDGIAISIISIAALKQDDGKVALQELWAEPYSF